MEVLKLKKLIEKTLNQNKAKNIISINSLSQIFIELLEAIFIVTSGRWASSRNAW